MIEGSSLPKDLKDRILSDSPPPPGVREEIHVTAEKTAAGPHPAKIIVKSLKFEPGDPARVPPPGHKDGRVLFLSGPRTATWIPIDQEGINRAVKTFQTRLLMGSVFILGLGFVVSAIVADRMASPMRALARAARTVESGQIGHQIDVKATGEAREAVDAFNKMSARLSELEEQALAMREREHMSELGEVARGLAHALRNPLHALGLSVDQLASQAAEEREGEDLRETARRQIRNLDTSIRSFLAFATADSTAEEEIDAASIAEDVALSALQDTRGRISLNVEAPAERPRLKAVSAELRAALQALVDNALDASPDGSAVEVSVRRLDEGRVRYAVSDRGSGVPLEVRARLFTPHLTTKAHGSGMGLFLTHRLAVTRYAGSLTLEERDGGGTVAVLVVCDRMGGPRG